MDGDSRVMLSKVVWTIYFCIYVGFGWAVESPLLLMFSFQMRLRRSLDEISSEAFSLVMIRYPLVRWFMYGDVESSSFIIVEEIKWGNSAF